jgi:hypothetical protein
MHIPMGGVMERHVTDSGVEEFAFAAGNVSSTCAPLWQRQAPAAAGGPQRQLGRTYTDALSYLNDNSLDHGSLSVDLAWAAGFVDGEGCISVVEQLKPNQRSTHRVRFQVAQNNLPVLEHLNAVLGGMGRIYSMRRTAAHNRQMYMLLLDGWKAVAVVAKLAPYLVRKKQEAEVLLEGLSECWFGIYSGPTGFPEHVYAARRRLERKLQKLK